MVVVPPQWSAPPTQTETIACTASAVKAFLQKNTDLIRKGLKDWKNASPLLKVHEDSQEHNTHMATWKELEVVLQSG